MGFKPSTAHPCSLSLSPYLSLSGGAVPWRGSSSFQMLVYIYIYICIYIYTYIYIYIYVCVCVYVQTFQGYYQVTVVLGANGGLLLLLLLRKLVNYFGVQTLNHSLSLSLSLPPSPSLSRLGGAVPRSGSPPCPDALIIPPVHQHCTGGMVKAAARTQDHCHLIIPPTLSLDNTPGIIRVLSSDSSIGCEWSPPLPSPPKAR